MPKADRLPGPEYLWEVNTSARRRWWERPEELEETALYRPPTLVRVAGFLDNLEPAKLGIGPDAPVYNQTDYVLYDVQPHDGLRALAKKFYGDPNLSGLIHEANLDKIDDPDLIFAGQSLRIPKAGLIEPSS